MSERTGPMACPVDGTALVMSERQNIEIDYCPSCRGVWLDRGELDKIIERSAPEAGGAVPPPRQQPGFGGAYRSNDPDDRHYRHGKRRKSFLEELFD